MNAAARSIENRNRPTRAARGGSGYILIEVLLAMTILATAGVYIIQSIRTCIDQSRSAEGITRAMFLTQNRVLELELEYANRWEARTGRDDGTYEDMGHPDYWWESDVLYDRKRGGYEITVTTFWRDKSARPQFRLQSLVPEGRVREDLLR